MGEGPGRPEAHDPGAKREGDGDRDHREEDRVAQELEAELTREARDVEDPPLRQRAGDVQVLARHFLAEFARAERMALNAKELEALGASIYDEMVGLGPIEPLLKDDSINDILINGPYQVYIERRGELELTPIRFRDNDHLLRIVNRIVAAVGRRIDESQPMVDARLPDGSRVNAIIPPLALDGALLSIRRFGKKPLLADDLVNDEPVAILRAPNAIAPEGMSN